MTATKRTLAEFLAANPDIYATNKDGYWVVITDLPEIFWLSDHKVSSAISASQKIMVPVKKDTP